MSVSVYDFINWSRYNSVSYRIGKVYTSKILITIITIVVINEAATKKQLK